LPDTFYLDGFISSANLPSLIASTGVVQVVQIAVMVNIIPLSVGLTTKLCDDNNVGNLRFGLHASIQGALACSTLYLMVSSNQLVA